MRIFLGGTCADTTWREEFIKSIEGFGIEYFNPVVKDWTPECQAIEEDEKNNKCDCHLYVITKEMMGTYSIAEIINSAWQAVVYGTTVNFVVFAVLDDGNSHKEHNPRGNFLPFKDDILSKAFFFKSSFSIA